MIKKTIARISRRFRPKKSPVNTRISSPFCSASYTTNNSPLVISSAAGMFGGVSSVTSYFLMATGPTGPTGPSGETGVAWDNCAYVYQEKELPGSPIPSLPKEQRPELPEWTVGICWEEPLPTVIDTQDFGYCFMVQIEKGGKQQWQILPPGTVWIDREREIKSLAV
jgi:hypothetical protein